MGGSGPVFCALGIFDYGDFDRGEGAWPLSELLSGGFMSDELGGFLPPYVLMLGLTCLFFGVGWMRQWYWYVFLMNFIVALQKQHPPPFEVLWSLAVEEQFYLVWPFVVYLLSETGIAWAAGGLMVAAPVLRWVCTPWFRNHWAVYTLMPFRMDLLAAGALLAVVWRRRRGWIEGYGGWGLAAAAGAGAALIGLGRRPEFSTYANTREANVWVYELCLVGAVGIVTWALSGRGVGVLAWRPVRYVGRISYSIYLLHTLALMVVGDWIGGWLGAVVAGAVSVGYAAVSWRWFEMPILRWRGGTGAVFRGPRDGMRSGARLSGS